MATTFIPIPANTPPKDCTCGQRIYWAPFPSTGKPHPVSVKHEAATAPTLITAGKGISHFADCPDANKHRRAR